MSKPLAAFTPYGPIFCIHACLWLTGQAWALSETIPISEKTTSDSIAISQPAQTKTPQPSLDQVKVSTESLDRLFKQAEEAIKAKVWKTVDRYLSELETYPLRPYLQAVRLHKQMSLASEPAIKAFHEQHPDTLSRYILQLNWLYFLAREKAWPAFIETFNTSRPFLTKYKALPIELQCLHIRALASTGKTTPAVKQAKLLWLSPKSLPSACDWPIKYLKREKLLSQSLIWDRFQLAIDNKSYQLARYLKNKLGGQLREDAEWYYRRMRSPKSLANHPPPKSMHKAPGLLTNILSKLVWQDPEQANSLWKIYDKRYHFSLSQRAQWAKQAAIKYSIGLKQEAQEWLSIALAHHRTDTELLTWRLRYAIGTHNWPLVLTTYTQLPPSEQIAPIWRYWKARALAETRLDIPAACSLLIGLSAQRDFYGFLAAETLSVKLPMNASSKGLDIQDYQTSEHSVFPIAESWLRLNRPWRARQEYWYVWKTLNSQQKKAALQKAHHWGWHDYVIQGLADIQEWDALEYRFPLAYAEHFENQSRRNGIEPTWSMAVARQESGFNPSAKSWVGATGLMQLMPSTAKSVAKRLGLKHHKWRLIDPHYNIKLGTGYLGQMTKRFKGNSVFATAAYNAGPHRVDAWNKRLDAEVDMDVWIEIIPIKETRDYVKRVLTYSAIYAHLNDQPNPQIMGKWLPNVWNQIPIKGLKAETNTDLNSLANSGP